MSTNVSRRSLLKTAVAGAAAVLPATTSASDECADRRLAALTDDEQLEACVEDLKSILSRLHPECDGVRSEYRISPFGEGTIVMKAKLPKLPWTGPGIYELLHDDGRSRDVFHVERFWNDDDRCWEYYAAFIWDGNPVAPREFFSEQRLHILRKVEA